jgi:hypothetical protein
VYQKGMPIENNNSRKKGYFTLFLFFVGILLGVVDYLYLGEYFVFITILSFAVLAASIGMFLGSHKRISKYLPVFLLACLFGLMNNSIKLSNVGIRFKESSINNSVFVNSISSNDECFIGEDENNLYDNTCKGVKRGNYSSLFSPIYLIFVMGAFCVVRSPK